MDLPQSNDRQPTSKSRGICRYYSTSRGCFAGDKCKFLHGEQEKITPFDRSKTCIYYAQGYCRRGSQCWFKHVAPSTPQPASSSTEALSSTPYVDPALDSSDDLCSICFEKPITYGLLVGCSHVFCINCIREWRAPANKSTEVVSSGVIKKCPYCRVEARFITPSSVFYPEGHAGKHMTIERYKSSMARVPCRYFQQSRRDKRFCPFGKDCFYQHTNDDGTPFVFEQGVEESMRNRRSQSIEYADLEAMRETMRDLRQSITRILWTGDEPEDDGDREGGGEGDVRGEDEMTTREMLANLTGRVLASLQELQEHNDRFFGPSVSDQDDVSVSDQEPTGVDAASTLSHSEGFQPFRVHNGRILRNYEEYRDHYWSLSPRDRGTMDILVTSNFSPETLAWAGLPPDPLAQLSHAHPPPPPDWMTNPPPSNRTDAQASASATPSRFSTVVTPVGFREQMIINLEDEEDDEDNEADIERRELVDYSDLFEVGSAEMMERLSLWAETEAQEIGEGSEVSGHNEEEVSVVLQPEVVTPPAVIPQPPAVASPSQSSGEGEPTGSSTASSPRPTIQFNSDPPFVSDGRGRVVWSSIRGRPARERGK